MSRVTFAILTSIACFILFALTVMASGLFGHSMRIDLSEGRIYSLSSGAKQTVRNLAEPSTLTFYFSREAAASSPVLRSHATQIRETLASMRAASGGRLSVQEIDPTPFSPREDDAIAGGLVPAATKSGKIVYLGLVGKSRHGQAVAIPFLDPKRSAFLEYDLTRLVAALDAPKRTKIALITSLPLKFGVGGAAAFEQGASKAFTVYDELARIADIELSGPDFQTLPKDADILMIAHPWPLTPQQLYAVDQFILAKRRALIIVDPATWIASAAAGGAQYAAPPSSELHALLGAWGINISSGVVVDKDRALPIEAVEADGRTAIQPQPLFQRLFGEDVSSTDPITASLGRGVHVAAPGAISVTKTSPFHLTALVSSSKASSMISANAALGARSPSDVLARYHADGHRHILAARLHGMPKSAFPNGPPSGLVPLANGNSPARQATSRPVELVVLADADMLDDGFYIDPQSRMPVADNAGLIVNAIEVLTGTDQLLSLRARTTATRRLTRLDAMQANLSSRLGVEEARLSKQLQETERRLVSLRAQKFGTSTTVLGPSIGEIERSQLQAVAVRKRLREIRHAYDVGMQRMRLNLLAVNTIVGPALLILFGVGIALRRRIRARFFPLHGGSDASLGQPSATEAPR